MKMNKLTSLVLVLVLGTTMTMVSCGDDDDSDPTPECTFQSDKECFCDANPTDERCEEDTVCTFESDPTCFCEANPTDENCVTEPAASYMDNAVLGYTFEGVTDPLTTFNNGTTGGTWNGEAYDAWADGVADVSQSIASGEAAEGDEYLSLDFEVITEGWNWVSNVNWQPGTETSPGPAVNVGSLTDPHLVFAVKSGDITSMQFETAFNDSQGQSGTNTAMDLAVSSSWKVYALSLTQVVWNWGTGPDWSDIVRVQLGFNINGKTAGDVFTLDVDGVGIISAADLPEGATLVDQTNPTVAIIHDFEGAAPEDVFLNGFTGGTFDGITYDAWTTNAEPTASIANSGAAKGSDFLSVSLEVLTTGWAWVGNINAGNMGSDGGTSLGLDLSEVDDPHLNFYAKTDGDQFQFESAIDFEGSQAGFHVNFEETTEWQLVSVRMDSIAWDWGAESVDFSKEITRFQMGFNINEQDEVGDVVVVDIDHIHITSGAASFADVVIDEMPVTNGRSGRKED